MKSNSSNHCELNSLISVLRAIVMSRKQPCSLLAVMKDYHELENRQLPFHKFGFTSPKELFSQSGEFHVKTMAGETYVAAIINNRSAHIVDLVRKQKSSGRVTHLTKPAAAPRRLHTKQVQNKVIPKQKASQSLSYLPAQHQISQQDISDQLSKRLQQQLQRELEKQKQQLHLNFEKEKENLKKTFLAEFEVLSVELKTKNTAANSFSQSIKKPGEITDELKKLNERIKLLESKSNVTNDSFVALELEENKHITAELEKFQKQLSLLSLGTENKKPFSYNMLSVEKQQSKEKRNQATPENLPTQPIKEAESKAQIKQLSQHVAGTKNAKNRLQCSATQQVSPSVANDRQNHVDKSSDLPPTDLRHRLNAIRSQKQVEKPISKDTIQSESIRLRPILGQQNMVGNHQVKSLNRNISNINNKMSKNVQQISQQSKIMEPPSVPQKHCIEPKPTPLHQNSFPQQQQQKPARSFPKQQSVQNRLKLNTNCDKNAESCSFPLQSKTVSQTVSIKAETEKIKQSVQKPKALSISMNQKTWKFDPKVDPCTSIALYCAAKKYGEPKYNVFRSKQGLYDCQLVVNTNSNTIYSTYPQEFTTEAKARFACAEKAIQQIQIVEARSLLPTFPDNKEFLKVLYNELLLHPNGIISDKMSEWFIDRFGFTMPENWFKLIKNCARFIIEDGIRENTFIILANKDAEDDNQLAFDEAVSKQMELLKLPWSEKSWQLYITHCVSTVEIWGRLLGDEYNDCLDKLNSELKSHMCKEKVRPDVIAPNHIYLVELNSDWHRVRVESLDKEKQKVFCFYIDFGDTDNLSVNELYLCDPKFLWLPPQGVPFALFGLEDLTGNPYAIKELKGRLLNRAVVIEVLSKEAEFQANGVIQAMMFDTSTEEDINLNLLLKDEICKQSQAPQLKVQGTTPVKVTNIDPHNGDVSLQIINADSEYVQATLKQIVELKFNRELKCSGEELLMQQLLLVHDEDYSVEWFRAKIIDINQAQKLANGRDEMVDVLYIDYNISSRVHISKIYRLESLSKALSTFSPQAIQVKLHNIPEFNQNIIGRMRALLPESCQAFVRVEIPGDVPYVTILRKVNGPDMPYCNINDDLRLEIERAKDVTLCTKDLSNGSALPSTSEALQSPTQLLRSIAYTSTPMLPLKISELPMLKEYDINLPLNSTFSVYVILVSNPLSFTVQRYNEDFQRLLNMMKQLQDYCVNNDTYIPADMVKIGQAYAAKKEKDYYRVIAKAQFGDMINVSFCDYGDSGTVRSDHLKVLPLQFRQLPKMGINARLYGIKGNSDNVWSTDDVQRFRDLVLGKKMACFLKGTRRDEKDALELTLDLVDVDGEEDINIRKVLLLENRAVATAPED